MLEMLLLIVDDEAPARERLRALLGEIGAELAGEAARMLDKKWVKTYAKAMKKRKKAAERLAKRRCRDAQFFGERRDHQWIARS